MSTLFVRLLTYSLTSFFFFTDTPTTEIYTLSLHDALPILRDLVLAGARRPALGHSYLCGARTATQFSGFLADLLDRKSTRLNSSHPSISYAVFCLKKKRKVMSTHPAWRTSVPPA